MIIILPQTTLHDFDNFGGVSLPSNWNNAKKEKFWCNDANFGLLRNPAEVKFVSQKYQKGTNACTITVNGPKNKFGYKNCDCSGPRKYNFKDEGRFLEVRGFADVSIKMATQMLVTSECW